MLTSLATKLEESVIDRIFRYIPLSKPLLLYRDALGHLIADTKKYADFIGAVEALTVITGMYGLKLSLKGGKTHG